MRRGEHGGAGHVIVHVHEELPEPNTLPAVRRFSCTSWGVLNLVLPRVESGDKRSGARRVCASGAECSGVMSVHHDALVPALPSIPSARLRYLVVPPASAAPLRQLLADHGYFGLQAEQVGGHGRGPAGRV